ncbi:WD40 repeat-containing protein, putative [Bodo saltans]|uniref:WD40 repeat-containing protein, putative n=1 Tax=Bodo saltans TaxID=75058 RepID=A0A0S4JPZ3_BODSA|nr:WD40 repeat-containing protein, putative [Bodo saltans]|eukprot:CUG92391.1 WD40 repeat-containing protein, putative [Bodo saltans]
MNLADSDDDVEYDPTAVSLAPQPVVHAPRAVAPTVAATAAAAIPSAAVRSETASAFPLLTHWRMPQKSPVTAVAMQQAGSILCVGNREGSVFMFNFLERSDDATSVAKKPAKTPTPSSSSTQQGGHRSKEDALQKPFAPTRIMTPFPTSYGKNLAITQLGFLPSTHIVLLGCDGDHLMAVDASSGRQMDRSAVGSRSVIDTVRSPGHKAALTDVAYLAGERFCTSSLDGTVRLWDLRKMRYGSSYAAKHGQDGSATLTTTIAVNSCCVMGDSVLSGGADGFIQVWDARSSYRPGRSSAVIAPPTEGSVSRLLAVSDHSFACLYGSGQLCFIDVRKPTEACTVASQSLTHRGDHVAPKLSLCRRSSAPSTLFAVMTGVQGASSVVKEFDLQTGRALRTLQLGHTSQSASTGSGSPEETTDGIPCVAVDEVGEQMIVGDGVSSTVRLHSSTSSKRPSSTPAQQWCDWTSGKREGAVQKRPRELIDDGDLELF